MKKQSLQTNTRNFLFCILLPAFISCTPNNPAGVESSANSSDSARDHSNPENARMPSDTINAYRNKAANTGDPEADHNTSTPGMPASATPAASGHK